MTETLPRPTPDDRDRQSPTEAGDHNHFRWTEGEFFGHPVAPTLAIAERWHALDGRRVVFPSSPQTGEGLPDLILRSCGRNGHEFTSGFWMQGLNRRINHFGHRYFVDVNVSSASIADYLGTPNGAVDIDPLRYAKTSAGVVSFFGASIFAFQLARHRRVSPRFLATHGYQKAIWSILPLTFDPANREYLLDRCPNPDCKALLTFDRTLGLQFCHACRDPHTCKPTIDLRDFTQATVELPSFENVELACSLVDPAFEVTGNRVGQLHPDLRSFDRGRVFQFLLLLARLVDHQHEERVVEEFGKSLSKPVSPSALDEAVKAVRNWPGGVIELAERTKDCWRLPALTWIAGKTPVVAEVYYYKKFFGLDFYSLVRDQIGSGLASDIEPTGHFAGARKKLGRWGTPTIKNNGFHLQRRDHRIAFATIQAQRSKAVRSERKSTGLPFFELAKLYADGLVRHPDRILRGSPTEDGSALAGLHERFEALSPDGRSNGLSLYELANAVSRGGLVWSPILRGVLNGEIEISIPPGTTALINRITIADVDAIRSVVASKGNEYDEFLSIPLTYSDVGFYLGLASGCVAGLVINGLLPKGGLTIREVLTFRENFITGGEIHTLMALNQHHNRFGWAIKKLFEDFGVPRICEKPAAVRDRRLVTEVFTRLGYQY